MSFLETRWPIIQAPMAGVQGAALAIAVSKAGGLGSLPCAMFTAEAMRKELAAIRAAIDRPYNVNFFVHSVPPAAPQRGTCALWPQVVAAVKEPVVAAGGIADARGVRAALALGASAVQIGTGYLLCPEATTSAVHRAALKSKEARNTVLTNLFTG